MHTMSPLPSSVINLKLKCRNDHFFLCLNPIFFYSLLLGSALFRIKYIWPKNVLRVKEYNISRKIATARNVSIAICIRIRHVQLSLRVVHGCSSGLVLKLCNRSRHVAITRNFSQSGASATHSINSKPPKGCLECAHSLFLLLLLQWYFSDFWYFQEIKRGPQLIHGS